jgi:carbonic anhydrase
LTREPVEAVAPSRSNIRKQIVTPRFNLETMPKRLIEDQEISAAALERAMKGYARRFDKLAHEHDGRLQRAVSVLSKDEPFASLGAERRAALIREQSIIVEFEADRAINTLSALLSEEEERKDAIAVVEFIAGSVDDMDPQRQKFRELAERGQHPHTLVIGCCDSGVTPEEIFDAEPGEIFDVRNVANLVPPHTLSNYHHGSWAAIDFAVCHLQVRHIVVLGHARCGGVRAFLERYVGDTPFDMEGLHRQLDVDARTGGASDRSAAIRVRPSLRRSARARVNQAGADQFAHFRKSRRSREGRTPRASRGLLQHCGCEPLRPR